MTTTQVSVALSVVALVLSLLSVGIHIAEHREGQQHKVGISLVGNEGAKDGPSEPAGATPNIGATGPVTSDLETKIAEMSTQLGEKVARLERGLDGVNHLIRASGLDVAVPMWGAGPGAPGPLFEQLGKEAAGRAQFEARREELSRQAQASQDRDYSRYGAERYGELEDLYRAARPGRGAGTEEDRTKRTNALNQMREEFPEAYATGAAIAEQALNEALNGNAAQVEAYLQSLTENSQYANIVTDQGVEAVPNIQAYLARQYIEQNRLDEAVALLDDLSQRFPDSLIMEPNVGGPPSPPRSARDIAAELRQQIVTGN